MNFQRKMMNNSAPFYSRRMNDGSAMYTQNTNIPNWNMGTNQGGSNSNLGSCPNNNMGGCQNGNGAQNNMGNGCQNGSDCQCLNGKSLAMVYSPCQEFERLYESDEALKRGTLYIDLDKPFLGRGRNI